jgi:hypothetical protein
MFKLSTIGAVAALTIMGTGLLTAAPACTSEDAAAYVALGTTGCTITVGSTIYTFSDFSFVQSATSGTSGGTATSVFLTPDTTGGVGFDITNPGGAWSANATSVNDDDLMYLVSVSGGTISNMYLSMTGSAGAPTSGSVGGLDTLTETLCASGTFPPGSCPGGAVSNGGSLQINGDPTAQSGVTVSQSLSYATTTSLSVDKDIQIGAAGGASTGASSLTDVKNLVNATPEPSTYAFLAVACGALLGIKKYRQRKATA